MKRGHVCCILCAYVCVFTCVFQRMYVYNSFIYDIYITGMDAFLSKPFKLEDINEAYSKLLEKVKYNRYTSTYTSTYDSTYDSTPDRFREFFFGLLSFFICLFYLFCFTPQ